MPASNPTPWLICYDIADPKRLNQVFMRVRQFATPLQRSVFQAHATRRQIVRRLEQLRQVIRPDQDDVRAYPLLTAAPAAIYGRRPMPDGVYLIDRHTLFDSSPHEPRN